MLLEASRVYSIIVDVININALSYEVESGDLVIVKYLYRQL